MYMMHRAAVTLCLMSRVISVLPVQHLDSHHASRQSSSSSVHSKDGYLINQFGDAPSTVMFSNGDMDQIRNKYSIIEPYRSNYDSKKRMINPHYSDFFSFSDTISDTMRPYTKYPSKYETEYEISRARANSEYNMAKYVPADVKTDIMIARLKSMMHYEPQEDDFHHEPVSFYDSSSGFSRDDDDIRSSRGAMYDRYYWTDMINSDIAKVKDKRYADGGAAVKPVHEHIENDVPNTVTQLYTTVTTTDNPIVGDGPFFSFVLNDYYDKNDDDDRMSFNGVNLNWERDVERQSSSEKPKKDNYLDYNYNYLTPIVEEIPTNPPPSVSHFNSYSVDSPKNIYETQGFKDSINNAQIYQKVPEISAPSAHLNSGYQGELTKGEDFGQNYKFNKPQKTQGQKGISIDRTDFDVDRRKYNEFRDFLDSVANKFGIHNQNREVNFENESSTEKGEKKKGFQRVYHKNEFQEDKEFYDNSKNSAKGNEKGHDKVQLGGSEGILRTQALAAVDSTAEASMNTENINSGNIQDLGHENVLRDAIESNIKDLKDSKFLKFVNVAKQVANSNDAHYPEYYEAWPNYQERMPFLKKKSV